MLAVDCGTTSAKAALVAASGAVLATGSARVPPGPSPTEQRPRGWVDAVLAAAAAALLARRPETADEIAALALSGQMQATVLLRSGAASLLARDAALLHSDGRASAEALEVERAVAEDPEARRALNAKGGASVLAKLLWLKRREPAALHATTGVLLGAADFVAHALTAERCAVTDRTTASTCGLVAPCGERWADNLVAAVGLDPELLPALGEPGVPVGTVAPGLPAPLDALEGLPVFHAGGDVATCTMGSVGIRPGGGAYAYVGTSGWVACTEAGPADGLVGQPGLFALLHPVAGHRIRAASMVTAGGCAEWARGALGFGSLAELDAAAASAPAGSRGALFAPHLSGERSPFTDASARGAFVNLSRDVDRACLARASLEGVALNYRAMVSSLGDVAGGGAALPFTGGGARSRVWGQVFADVLQTPVRLVPGDDAGLRGTAAPALGGSGLWGADPHAPPDGFTEGGGDVLEPNASARGAYDDAYARFRELRPSLVALQSG